MYQKLITACLLVFSLMFTPYIYGEEEESFNYEEQVQLDEIHLGDVVVTATKTSVLETETGASVTVISKDDIEQSGERRLSGVLEKTPGVTVMRSGQYGGQTSISIRGSHQKDVLVMIDGVRVNDVSQINRDFDFGGISTANIERIEIIRSGGGVLYGSEASGGVINIITKKGETEPVSEIKAGAGSNNTFRGDISSYGRSDIFSYSAFISREYSDGLSKADSPDGGKVTDDSFSELSLGTNIAIDLGEDKRASMNLRYTSADYGMDDGAMNDNPHRNYSRSLLTGNLSFYHEVNDIWDYSLLYSRNESLRSDKNDEPDPSEASWFEGKTEKGEFQNNFNIQDVNVFTAGASVERDTVSTINVSSWGNDASNDKDVYSIAGYAQNHLKLDDSYFFITGIRVDKHELYGTDVNYSQSVSTLFSRTGTRLTGNIATGFKAPSLYQLYDPGFGNKDLSPEESLTWDVGIEQNLLNELIFIGITYFRGSYSNLIEFPVSNYANVDEKVKTEGVELETVINKKGDLILSVNYTYTKSYKEDTKEDLLRRPRHQFNAVLNWFLMEKINLNLSYLYRGERDDIDESWSRITMDSYYRFDFSGSYIVNDIFSIFARVENLTNNDYTEMYGYKTDGINFFAGIKAVF